MLFLPKLVFYLSDRSKAAANRIKPSALPSTGGQEGSHYTFAIARPDTLKEIIPTTINSGYLSSNI
jgi:hypothetical protein